MTFDPSTSFEIADDGLYIDGGLYFISGAPSPVGLIFPIDATMYFQTNGDTWYNPGSGAWVLKNGGGSVSIPEYPADPSSPATNDAWVLRQQGAGSPIGLLLSLTYATNKYKFSYRTIAGETVRVGLE